MVLYNLLIGWLLRRYGYRAITLWPLVFLASPSLRQDKRLMRHEAEHLRQQKKLWILPFYILYIYEYLKGRFRGLTHDAAYRGISFEVEARKAEVIS